jgi:uncharacterized membrane protein
MNKLVSNHPRFWIALGLGTVVFLFLPPQWSLISRILMSWDCGVAFFLVLIYAWMASLSAAQICSRYVEEDTTGPFIVIVVIIAALLSLVAIVEPLATLRHASDSERIWRFALAAVTLMESWLIVPTMFTTHYADMFYSTDEHDRPLSFPETPMPVFWDFAYFSFTIAAACQTADVLTRHVSIRKVVIAHEVISFLFNASILGFAINVTAGLIGGN